MKEALTVTQLERLTEAIDNECAPVRELILRALRLREYPDRRCGVYILLKKNAPVYVGQAKCIGQRMADHLKTKDFDRYAVIECAPERLLELERLVITILNPPLNRCGGERVNGKIIPIRPLKIPKRL